MINVLFLQDRGRLRRHKSSLHPVDSTTLNMMSVESDTGSIEIFTDDSDDEDRPVTSSILQTLVEEDKEVCERFQMY